MFQKIAFRLASVPVIALLGLTSPLLACSCEKSEVEKLSDDAKDAFDVREHEALKDAGEDATDAVKDTGAALKEGAESLKDD